jgi:hypothetical protein
LFPNLIPKICHGAASVLHSSFVFRRLGVWFYFEKISMMVLVLEISKILLRLGFQFYAGFLLGLLFSPEDGGEMFLQNFE